MIKHFFLTVAALLNSQLSAGRFLPVYTRLDGTEFVVIPMMDKEVDGIKYLAFSTFFDWSAQKENTVGLRRQDILSDCTFSEPGKRCIGLGLFEYLEWFEKDNEKEIPTQNFRDCVEGSNLKAFCWIGISDFKRLIHSKNLDGAVVQFFTKNEDVLGLFWRIQALYRSNKACIKTTKAKHMDNLLGDFSGCEFVDEDQAFRKRYLTEESSQKKDKSVQTESDPWTKVGRDGKSVRTAGEQVRPMPNKLFTRP